MTDKFMEGEDLRREWGFPLKLNKRVLPVILLFFIAGIISCTLDFIYCIICLSLLIFAAFILLIIGYADKPLFILCVIFTLLSLSYFGVVNSYNKNVFYSAKSTMFSGRVIEVGYNSYTLDRLNINGKEYDGKLRLVYNDELDIGSYVSCNGIIQSLEIKETDSYVMHSFAQKEYYSCETVEVVVDYIDDIPLRVRIIEGVRVSILEAVGEDVAGFAVSMLFGSTEYLNYSTKLDYRTIGAAHVFAVSGLHVGVVLGIIFFFFKIFNRTNLKSIPLLIVILGFYAFLCDFSPSVIRASVMAISYLFLRTTKHCPDKLNVISFAALSSLMIKPHWLFDISFLLSYFAILGIFLVYPQVKRFLSRFMKKGVDSLSMNLSVSISLAPLTIFFFDEFSLFSVFASLFVIPIASFVFILFFASLPIVWYTPIAIYPLALAKYILTAMNYLISLLTKVNIPISLNILPSILPLWYAGVLVLSDYNVANKPPKRILGYSILISSLGLCFI